MFTYGGVGSFEATWMDFESITNDNVKAVFADHQRLREFIETIPISINEMDVDTATIISGPRDESCRSKPGACYAAYFLGSRGQNTTAGNTSLTLPTGTYSARWYHPRTGEWTTPQIISGGGAVSMTHPAFSEDVALLITLSTGGGGVAPVVDAVRTLESQPITGDTVTLQVDITDPDTDPDDLIISWSVIDHPPGQSPGLSPGDSPLVNLYVAGTYRFGVTVSDDTGSGQGEVEVVVAQTATTLLLIP